MQLYTKGNGWFNVHASPQPTKMGKPMTETDIAKPGPLMAGKRGLVQGTQIEPAPPSQGNQRLGAGRRPRRPRHRIDECYVREVTIDG